MSAESKVFLIYCDESGITDTRFMVIGGIIINSKALFHLKTLFDNYRSNYNMVYELKWQKVSTNRLPHYKALIDLVFDLIEEGRMNFRCAIFDTTKFNHKRYNRGDAELGFYKFYYNLLFYCFGQDYHRFKHKFVVFPDQKPGKYDLSELKSRLNNNMFYKLGNRSSPFGSIEATNSKKSDFIQVVDLIIGAISYQINNYNKEESASPAKVELSNYIASKVGLQEFSKSNFYYKKKKFTIWDFNLKEK